MKHVILGMLTAIFILAGLFIPYINAEYGIGDSQDYDVPSSNIEDSNIINLGSTFLSILSMFFWTFGALPIWLDAIFLIFRFMFWYIMVDILWIG